jgi:hypothetical protein
MRARSVWETAGFVPAIHRKETEPCSAKRRMALASVGRCGPVRDDQGVDVPQFGQLADVFGVVPVAEAGQGRPAAGLTVVLRRGLAVHLQDAGPGAPEHAAQQVQVVDLAGGGGGLVRLVEAHRAGGDDPRARAEDLRCRPDVLRGHAADPRRPLRGRLTGEAVRLVEAHGVRLDVVAVHPVVGDQFVDEGVHQGEVGTVAQREVHGGPFGHRGAAGVRAHQAWPVLGVEAVEHPGPQHALGLGDVVPEEEEGVAVVDVVVGAGLAVGAEGLLEGGRGGGGAQPGVAVHPGGADARLPDDAEGVVLLDHQLAGGVEGVAERSLALQQRPGTRHDRGHRVSQSVSTRRPFSRISGVVSLSCCWPCQP